MSNIDLTKFTPRQKKCWDDIKTYPNRYPKYANLTDEQLLKKIDDMLDDMSMRITVTNNKIIDLTIQKEVALFLADKPDVAGLYYTLEFLWSMGSLEFQTQLDIAKFIGYSENTYYKLRSRLVKLGLIQINKNGRRQTIQFNFVHRLSEFSKIPVDPSKHFEFFKSYIPKIKFDTPEIINQTNKQSAQVLFDGIVKEKAQEMVKKKEVRQKKEEARFPNEYYESVLNAFKKYKKIGLMGPEIVRAKKAIKQMFLADRSPKQIIDCMKFFADHNKEDEYKWLQNWTLETVMKKIPEFLGGQLKSNRMEDQYPSLK